MTDTPNVVFISIDSLRADACSFLEGDIPTTPNLDALSDESATFRSAISPTIWTQPSHASIFTGLYPHEHQLRGSDEVLGDHPTLAEILRSEGWTTTAYGYNGWTRTKGVSRGFEYHRTPHPRESYPGIRKRLFQAKRLGDRLTYDRETRDETTIQRAADQIKSADGPFFTFAHLMGTHHAYLPRSPYYEEFTDRSRIELFWNQIEQRRLFGKRPEVYAGDFWPSQRTIETMKEQYHGCIRQADKLVGDVVAALRESGELNNTVLVVFGDHGECFGEDGVFGHQFSLDDALLRVPLLIRDPTGTIPTGEHDDLVQLNDLYPTILDLCGLEAPDTNSISIGTGDRETAFVNYVAPEDVVEKNERLHPSKRPLPRQYAAWRSPTEKLHWYPEKGEYGGPAAQNKELREVFESHLESLTPLPPQGTEQVSAEVKQNLQEMGYL
ncbi:sulfatase [Haladaptatus sp. DYF46]|uniref:sulfatase n=1 Tax=Haladaptatus sp. DYF46 TaxID=2886041 RepID=UPI001E35E0ED